MKFNGRLLEATDGTLMGGGVTPPAAPPADTGAPAAPAIAPVEGGAPATSTVPEWLATFQVESDIAGDPSLKAIKDVPSLIKSYVHAQKKMGADKITLPNKNSTGEEWLQLYHKLGLPTEFGQYEVKAEKQAITPEFMEDFRKTAYDQKLLPEQANAIFDFINNKVSEEQERAFSGSQEEITKGIEGLKQEWGDAFDQNIIKAKVTVKEFGGEDFQKYLNESGLGNNPQLIKVFTKIGENLLKEDKFTGEAKSAYALSPSAAQEKINQYTSDFAGPYYNSMHPDHNRVVSEVSKMFEVLSRPKK